MKLFTNLDNLKGSDRLKVGRFLREKTLHSDVQQYFQANGKGVGLNPDNIVKWLELILKFLPLFLSFFSKKKK